MPELILDPYLRRALLDSLMDATLLWVAASVVKQRVRWYRLLAGACMGGVYNLWLQLASVGFLPGWQLLTSFPVLFLLCPMFMLFLTFAPVHWRRFSLLGGVFATFSLLSWGLANAVVYFTALSHRPFNQYQFALWEIGITLIVAELGWGILHRRMIARVCRIPLVLNMGSFTLEAEGYLDTGNHLCDPIFRKPVIILDYTLIRDALTPASRCFIESVTDGHDLPTMPADDPWLSRLRVIPYAGVNSRGLMPGLRAEEVRLGPEGDSVMHHAMVIGLETGGRFAGECQALVPPALWR